MSHAIVYVVLPADTQNIEDALAQAMAPYDENLDVPRYMDLTRQQIIDNERANILMVKEHSYDKFLADPVAYEAECHNPRHLEYMRNEFADVLAHIDDDDFLYKRATQWGGDFDGDGNSWSTYNPNSKWDWYKIGGRWSRAMINAEVIGREQDPFDKEWYDIRGNGEDIIRKSDVFESPQTPLAFLDLDGVWHEKGKLGWWGAVHDEKDGDEWNEQFRTLWSKIPDDAIIVSVDYHI